MTQTTDSAPALHPAPGDPGQPSRLDAILEAACRVISRDGAHGLHMQAVAREAGVSKALVHYYVSTRRELLRQALAYADAKTRAALEQELAPLPHGRARLERMLVDYASSAPALSDSQALWNVAWGSLKLDDDLAPAVRAGYARWFAWISTLVEEGRADGSIADPRDTRTLAIELNALADGLWSLVDTDVVTRAEAADVVGSAVGALAPGRGP
jgi:AcrR family transcriptional regulator